MERVGEEAWGEAAVRRCGLEQKAEERQSRRTHRTSKEMAVVVKQEQEVEEKTGRFFDISA